jgi:hypothetical protein
VVVWSGGRDGEPGFKEKEKKNTRERRQRERLVVWTKWISKTWAEPTMGQQRLLPQYIK